MQEYPIGTFLFWELPPRKYTEYEFYKFLQNYHEKNARHNPKIDLKGSENVMAVLDGQQRLTTLFLLYWYACKKVKFANPNAQDDIWIARLPVSVNGQLKEVKFNIAMTDDSFIKGFLTCTENNFIRQAFKFLGDEYGWGGLNDSVDCSAFVQDVYRSMGINIPRDTGNQRDCMPLWAVFNNVSNAERWDIVSRAPIGAMLHKPGHVMMKLGNDADGKPLIIHAASSYLDDDSGKVYIRKVIVSDLHYRGGAAETIDALTDIVFYGDWEVR